MRWETTTISPDRGDGTGFARTLKATDASPCPLRAPLIDTQAGSPDTVQVQSRAVEMETVPDPPVAVKDDGVFETLMSQRLPVGAVVTDVSVEVQDRKSGRKAIVVRKAEIRSHIVAPATR